MNNNVSDHRSRLTGVIAAMNACYDDQGEIDSGRIRCLTRYLIERGVNGLYVGGSTGEGLIQNVMERKQVLEAVVAENEGQMTIIAHIGAINTRDTVELAQHAEQIGVDAISAIPPFYYPQNERMVQVHWNTVMDSTDLPFIIYNIPATTGFHLSTSLFEEMLQHPKMAGIKMTTASTYELQRFRAIAGPDLIIYNGPDEQYLAGRMMGASAGIGGTYGVMPELFLHIERHYCAGNVDEAQRMQFLVNEIITRLLALPLQSALKNVLKLRGVDCGDVRRPLQSVQQTQLDQIQEIYKLIMEAIESC